MQLSATKGHGTENDFVLVFDEQGTTSLKPALVRYLCDRRAGIGADGVIRAVRAAHVPEGAGFDATAWFMDYYNADGSTSEMCGNGARVFAAFLEREAGVDLSEGLVIGTRGGARTLRSLGDGDYAVGMGPWSIAATEAGYDAEVTVPGLDQARPGLSVDVGNPHTVVAVVDHGELDGADLSRPPLVNPPPPHGTNVELVVPIGETTGADGERRGHVRMRVHERGSGETRSCGTGACAVALAVRSWAGDGAPTVWDVDVPGGRVTVRITGDQTILEGPAVLVADLTITIPADVASR
ncbi:MAG: diaminopimelate epimerase [Actinobacteria bacterium HGW-Actinobacteria-4]|nr:MAG: diaminopimelate epimerase [Actinobacteria bacterium HGW-Actinobacteria-4]